MHIYFIISVLCAFFVLYFSTDFCIIYVQCSAGYRYGSASRIGGSIDGGARAVTFKRAAGNVEVHCAGGFEVLGGVFQIPDRLIGKPPI